MILLDIFEQREPHQLAIDALAQRRIEQIEEYIKNLKKAQAQVKDAEQRQAIQDRISTYEKERVDLTLGRTVHEVEQPQRAPAKGLLKGKDLVTPQQRVAGATPAKPGMAGAVKDVVGGVKRWLKGEPDQGPTFEEAAPGDESQVPEFRIMAELIAAWRGEQDYLKLPLLDGSLVPITRPAMYNALVALMDVKRNRPKKYQAYLQKILADEDTFMKWLATIKRYRTPAKKKGEPVQQTLGLTPPPVQPTAAEPAPAAPAGPMVDPDFQKSVGIVKERQSQKKKSKDAPIKDVGLAREIQKARARFPTAVNDVEAFAKDQLEINDKQTSQIQDLEQQLQQVQDTNAALTTMVKDLDTKLQVEPSVQMPAAEPAATAPVVPAVTVKPEVQPTPTTTPAEIPMPTDIGQPSKTTTKVPTTARKPRIKTLPAKDMGKADEVPRQGQIGLDFGLGRTLDQLPGQKSKEPSLVDLDLDNLATSQSLEKEAGKIAKQAIKKASKKSKAKAEIDEHGGGIGPRQHWQSLMRNEGWSDQGNPTPYAVYIDGRQWKEFRSDEEARRVADKVRANLKQQGRDQKVTIAPSQAWLNKKVKEGTADQFGQAVRMAGYTGRELEKDPAYKKSAQHARQEREQSQQNLARVKAGYGEEPDEYRDMDENFAMPGTTIPHKSVIQGYTVFFNPKTQVISVTRGGESEDAAIEQARIGTLSLKNFRLTAEKLIDKIESDEELINEGIKDTASATAVIACLLTGGSLSGCATAPQQTSAQQVLKTGQDIGRTVQTAKKITRAGTEAEVQQELRNILRGVSGHPEELNNSNILRIWRRIKGQPPVPAEPEVPEYGPAEPKRRMPQTESQEPRTKQEFDRALDGFHNQLRGETNPETRKRVNQELKRLQDLGRAHGWFKGIVREDTAALAAEDAILKRIFVKHRDLMMEYGPDKITQAAEEVAYNVGDIAHITDEQIQEWVGQVEYILGARP